jgi:hypothetical protein
MRRYRCHKEVEAAKIILIEHYRDRVQTADGVWHPMPNMVPRIQTGWYLVRYADGYLSASPPEPFEEGYTLIEQAAA